jgi:hypothetical protein
VSAIVGVTAVRLDQSFLQLVGIVCKHSSELKPGCMLMQRQATS